MRVRRLEEERRECAYGATPVVQETIGMQPAADAHTVKVQDMFRGMLE